MLQGCEGGAEEQRQGERKREGERESGRISIFVLFCLHQSASQRTTSRAKVSTLRRVMWHPRLHNALTHAYLLVYINALTFSSSHVHTYVLSPVKKKGLFELLSSPNVLFLSPAPDTNDQKGGLSEEAHSAYKGQHIRPVRDEGSFLHPPRHLHVSHRLGFPGPSEDVPLSRQLLHHRYVHTSPSYYDVSPSLARYKLARDAVASLTDRYCTIGTHA